MDRSPILFLIMLGMFLALVIVVYSSLMGTLGVTQRLFGSADSMGSLKKEVFPGYFSISKLRYYDRALVESQENNTEQPIDRCSMNSTKETMIIDLLVDSEKHPENCVVFVDNRLAKSFRLIDMPSATAMSNNILSHSVALQKYDIYSAHKISVCCDDICQKDVIEALCAELNQQN